MKIESQYGKMETSKGNLKRLPCPFCGHTLLFVKPETEIRNLSLKCNKCRRIVEVNISPVSLSL